MPWGAVIGAAGSIAGGLLGSKGSKDAAKTQKEATEAAVAEDRRQFDLMREDTKEYREQGLKGLRQFATEIDAPVTSADVMADPGYQFGLDQGQRSLSQRIAAGGGRVSGAALKAATRFGTDYASTGYGAAYQRKQDRLNRLAALADIGQTATGASAAAGAQSAGNISGLLSGQGNATAASQVARSSIWGNTANQLAALAGRYIPSQSGNAYAGNQAAFYGGSGTSGD